jgi:HK97 family phage portal protein
MGLIQRCRDAWNAFTRKSVSLDEKELLDWLGISTDGKTRKALNEVTYFTCIKMLSETMGKLPLKYYKQTEKGRIRAEPTDMTYLLSTRPNKFMTPTTLWTTTEFNCQHYGNAFIWIRGHIEKTGTYGGSYKVFDLWPMQSDYVDVIMDDDGIFGDAGNIYYQYSDPRTGEQYVFGSDEVMHFKTWYSLDGYLGVPVREILKTTIDGSAESQTFMNNLYKQGLTASMAMQYTGDLDKERREKLQRKYADAMTGSKNAGKIIPVPIGLTLTPLKMNLTDAQFFELRKYSALQIAGAFGIKPNQINNYEKSSYSNSENQQLTFLVDTMSYRLKMYEEEINAKALLPSESKEGFMYKFNEKAILRSDTKTQMEELKNAVNNGIYTPNEARAYVDMPWAEGGDILMVNGNYIPITDVGKQYEKGGEKDGNTGT